jgi:hypothetical protein
MAWKNMTFPVFQGGKGGAQHRQGPSGARTRVK